MTWIIVIGCIFLYFVIAIGLCAFLTVYNEKSNYIIDEADMVLVYFGAIFWCITLIPTLAYFLVYKKIYNAVYNMLQGEKQ